MVCVWQGCQCASKQFGHTHPVLYAQMIIVRHPFAQGFTKWVICSLLYLIVCSVYCIWLLVG